VEFGGFANFAFNIHQTVWACHLKVYSTPTVNISLKVALQRATLIKCFSILSIYSRYFRSHSFKLSSPVFPLTAGQLQAKFNVIIIKMMDGSSSTRKPKP